MPQIHLTGTGDESFCYVTTRGRVTGNEHEIEIWFAARDAIIYLLSGGGKRSDWVKNVLVTPEVQVRIAGIEYRGRARVVDDDEEASWARAALLEKYARGYSGDLTNWSRRSLPIAIELTDIEG
ncbi:MAG TPA: nitroreductase family deazaflavin-dependent oxidoreductase [Actinomycetota bacterium]|nr:nitroreductase family deazaflavin-dependent oxidoreductase [Actinomycetota bacterium]